MLYLSTMKQHKSIKIEQALIDKVNEEAKKENRSFNNKVEVIIEKYFLPIEPQVIFGEPLRKSK